MDLNAEIQVIGEAKIHRDGPRLEIPRTEEYEDIQKGLRRRSIAMQIHKSLIPGGTSLRRKYDNLNTSR
jgi:hypothetical protein